MRRWRHLKFSKLINKLVRLPRATTAPRTHRGCALRRGKAVLGACKDWQIDLKWTRENGWNQCYSIVVRCHVPLFSFDLNSYFVNIFAAWRMRIVSERASFWWFTPWLVIIPQPYQSDVHCAHNLQSAKNWTWNFLSHLIRRFIGKYIASAQAIYLTDWLPGNRKSLLFVATTTKMKERGKK